MDPGRLVITAVITAANGKSDFLIGPKHREILGENRRRGRRGRERGERGGKGRKVGQTFSGGYCGFCSLANHERVQPRCEPATPPKHPVL